jgi:phytol kinase
MNDFLGPLVGLGGVGVILLLSEFLWSTNIFKKAETPRKLVHILTGVYIAFWPLLMSFRWIQVLSLLLFAVVYASKRHHIFRSVHSVNRPTYGELLFPLGVLVSATFAQSGWVYMAAVLHLSVADGLAALVGVHFLHLRRYRYAIFGQPKTYIGSGAFFVTSLFIITATMLVDPAAYGENVFLVMLLLPIVTTVIENLAVFGTDNLFVPLAVIAVLGSLRVG